MKYVWFANCSLNNERAANAFVFTKDVCSSSAVCQTKNARQTQCAVFCWFSQHIKRKLKAFDTWGHTQTEKRSKAKF